MHFRIEFAFAKYQRSVLPTLKIQILTKIGNPLNYSQILYFIHFDSTQILEYGALIKRSRKNSMGFLVKIFAQYFSYQFSGLTFSKNTPDLFKVEGPPLRAGPTTFRTLPQVLQK